MESYYPDFSSVCANIRGKILTNSRNYEEEGRKAFESGDFKKAKTYLTYAARANALLEQFLSWSNSWNALCHDIYGYIDYPMHKLDAQQPPQKKPRAKKTNFAVKLPDGRMVKEASCAKTFARTIELIYPQEVAKLGLKVAGVDLVTQNPSTKVKRTRIALSNGWFVTTHSSTEEKRKCLWKLVGVCILILRL